MSEQLSFPGFELPQRSSRARPLSNGLFFALAPQATDLPWIVDVIYRLRASAGLRGNPLSSDCLHVSMYDLGAYVEPPKEVVAAACAAAAEISTLAFDMIFDRALTFPRRATTHPFVLRPSDEIAALLELHQALGLGMRKSGLKRWITSHFTPHMTLSYDPQIIQERAVEMMRWRVNELVLVRSLRGRGPGRNEHIHLARWPLQ